PTGDDTNDGCTSDRPKKTIAAAVAFVRALGAEAHTIRVCQGDYAENALLLDYPVSLLGGYSCATWSRSDASPPVTTVTAADPEAQSAALQIQGMEITTDVTVDGFTFNAPSAGAGIRGEAVFVRVGASPTLTNNVMRGGGTQVSDGACTIALDVED